MQAGTPARMAALLTKMLRRVECLMQYAYNGDGFRRLQVENYVRADRNRIETDDKFISLSTKLRMYAQTVAHILYITQVIIGLYWGPFVCAKLPNGKEIFLRFRRSKYLTAIVAHTPRGQS